MKFKTIDLCIGRNEYSKKIKIILIFILLFSNSAASDTFPNCKTCKNNSKENLKSNIFQNDKIESTVGTHPSYFIKVKKKTDIPFKLFVCRVDKTIGGFSKNYLLKWISVDQNHLFRANLTTFLNKTKSTFLQKENYLGKIKINNQKEIVWVYYVKSKEAKKPNGVKAPPQSTFSIKYTLRKKENKTEYGVNYRVFLDIFYMKDFGKAILSASGFCKLQSW